MLLHELATPISHLKGVGPATVADLRNLGVANIRDLLLHVPRDYEDRTTTTPLMAGASGRQVNTVVYVDSHEYFGAGRARTLKVRVRDESGAASLVCFGRNFLAKQLSIGSRFYLTGTFAFRFGELQSSQFDFEPWSASPSRFGGIVPIYPLSGKLAQNTLRRLIQNAVSAYATKLTEDLPPDLRRHRGLREISETLRSVHAPATLEEAAEARRALVYRELFYMQLRLARLAMERRASLRAENETRKSRFRIGDDPRANSGTRIGAPDLQDRVLKSLPFELTGDQKRIVDAHRSALFSGNRTEMLLQGEVGSGKTLVAFLMALPYVEAGHQVAFMAPTELLARQHAESASRVLGPHGVRIAFLSGSLKASARGPLVDALRTGEIDLLVGTHAAFTESVVYRSLRFVIIDEQHRFGVAQRGALAAKGVDPDLVLMTATPIPRSLALAVFGDMSVEEIHTMPAGRKPIETHLARQGNEQKVYDWVRREIHAGRQAYFVYPLIEQSEALELKDAESMFTELQHTFRGVSIGLIHSRVDEETKIVTMNRFQTGELAILVATSVVEVGVDVPNATCMVVEHAERFGLAALHQLRGRVGRGSAQSYAFLIYSPNLTEDGKTRLRVMLDQPDGFKIAEEDLKLRGPGDITGVQQSGYLRLRVADLARDMQVMLDAREDAFAILNADAGLLAPDHRNLRESLTAHAGEIEVTL